MSEALAEPDLDHCPNCGGPADNGHDRCIPPNPYFCSKCMAEPEQAPVAWRTFDGEGGWDYRTYEDNENYAAEWAQRNPRHVGWVEPLYTASTPRKPLTDEEIIEHFEAGVNTGLLSLFADGVRFAERAHGIGGQHD